MLIGMFLAASQWRPVTLAASASQDSAVQKATYATTAGGTKLKWLPRQSDVVEDTAAQPVAYTTPAPAPRTMRTAQKQRSQQAPLPPGDMFGERRANPSPAPATEFGGELQDMPAEPKASDSLPGLDASQPVEEKPYAEPESLTPPAMTKPSKKLQKHEQLSPERDFASFQHAFKDACPSPKDLKSIRELSTNIEPSEGELPHDCPLGNSVFKERSFSPMTYTWTASGLCHKPLYFEDVQLERYGHMAGPFVQPFASAAHFFLTVPILPYKMGLEPPQECMYTLGYYRPGDCAPYLFDPIPISARAGVLEASAWVGGFYLIP